MSTNNNAETTGQAEEIHNRGCHLWAEQKFTEAHAQFFEAYKSAPENPDILVSFGMSLIKHGELTQAEAILRQAIKLAPNNENAYDRLAHTLFEQKRMEEAAQVAHIAIKLKPNWFPPIHKLGACLMYMGDSAESLFWMEKAIKLEPKSTAALLNYGSALNRAGYNDEAMAQYFKAIEIDPSFVGAYYSILSNMEINHKMDDLDKLLEKAEKNIPNTQTLAIIKARLAKRTKKYDDAIESLEALKDEKSTIQSDLLFELGSLYDKTSQYDKAYEAINSANLIRLKGKRSAQFTLDKFPEIIDALAEPFVPDYTDSWSETYPSDTYKTPYFIVGFPRSGTTLLGQILDSHPDAFVAEEVEALERVRLYLSTTYPTTYPACIKSLGPGDVEKMRAIFYANHRNNSIWEENKTLIDKHPLNMIRAGLTYRMFPDAKMVFVARHPCDCILSNFMQNFGMNDAMVQMTSLETAINLYIQSIDTWKKYQKAMPDMQTYTIHYEHLIEDFNGEVAKLLEFLGLEWDDAVLAYNKNAKAKPRTNTPSYAQVIQPIYKSAANRWKNYERYFAPYMERLKPYIEELGYDA